MEGAISHSGEQSLAHDLAENLGRPGGTRARVRKFAVLSYAKELMASAPRKKNSWNEQI